MTARDPAPSAVVAYGMLGVIPFVAPPLAGAVFPAMQGAAGAVLALYGGLILSFLGGARWAFANAHPPPSPSVVSLSMLPTLVALALLALPADMRRLQLLGLAAALLLHWVWDLRGAALPAWYGWLRSLLTAGAVAGLLAGAFLLT
jgi:hypothetical protein